MPGKCEHGLTTRECMVCASPKYGERADAYRCIAPACKPLGCSDCNCAVPADVYAALGRAFAEAERERCAKVCEALTPKEPNCVWSAAYQAVGQDMAAAIRAA